MNSSNTIAIANRGEVAVRIHRACKKLGYKTLLLHSEPDKDSIAYRICDETFCIGGGPSSESYLNIKNIVQAAKSKNAIALHPGFGFLSENADFVDACSKEDLIFIGPSSESMRLFGDKISAKNFCETVNVPTLKSYRGQDQNLETLTSKAEKIGYPVLIKATAGGGGRGMRVVHKSTEFKEQLESAQNEALKAFGSKKVFIEKYLSESKHIEVQIFGDSQGITHVLGERECSVQRRHQKIIEEAPSKSLSKDEQKKVHGYAKTLTEKANYKNAGTVEFLYDGNEFYFLEVNTRLQVEHPVTEECFGVDLVQAQIKTAFHQKLNWKDLKSSRHSIECRIYAEDLLGFPSIGKIGTLNLGEPSSSIRIEAGFESKDEIGPFYDSMIGKLIFTEETRDKAIQTAIKHLQTCQVTGIYTNIPLLIKILSHQDFKNSKMTTKFFEKNFSEGLTSPYTEEELYELISTHKSKKRDTSLFSKNWRTSL